MVHEPGQPFVELVGGPWVLGACGWYVTRVKSGSRMGEHQYLSAPYC